MNPLRQTLATLVLALAFACAGRAGTPAPALKARFADKSDPAAAEALRYGGNAINRIAITLVREVKSFVAKSGPEGAVEACHLKNLPMVNGTVAGMPRITAMKRTSLKVRSPANKPDAADQLALDHIQHLFTRGEQLPSLLVQRVEPAEGAPEWRVYKPIGLVAQCLACHGDPAEQSEALKAKLHELYPDDQATGYKAGEWRGLIRVTVADK